MVFRDDLLVSIPVDRSISSPIEPFSAQAHPKQDMHVTSVTSIMDIVTIMQCYQYKNNYVLNDMYLAWLVLLSIVLGNSRTSLKLSANSGSPASIKA